MNTRLRLQSWFGLKRFVKRFLSLSLPNAVLRMAARVVPSLRSGRWPAPALLTEVVGRINGETFVMLDPARCENAKELYWGKGFRPAAHDRLALDTVASLSREANIFLDVGAYTGLFTLAVTAVQPQIVAHTFEIVPAVIDALEANVRRNRLERRVIVHREGIGEAGKTVRVPAGGGGSALPSFYSTRMTFEDGELVPLRSLDSVTELIGRQARVVMKVDVEGAEDEVFRSGQEFLESFRPDILCEVLHGQADGERLETLLQPRKLRWYLVADETLLERERIVPHDRFRDWLFSHRTPEELRGLGLPVA
jgi:FkbM family methyltransferase